MGEVSRSDRGVPSPAEEEPSIHLSPFTIHHSALFIIIPNFFFSIYISYINPKAVRLSYNS